MRPKTVGDETSLIREVPESFDRLFVFGDIHGHSEELSILLDFILNTKRCSAQDQLIFIGDYIDRGRGSNQVIESLLSLQQKLPKTIFLKGNHEEMLLGFLGLGGSFGEYYLKNGGGSFFESYGITEIGSLSHLRNALPQDHLFFLQNLELAVSTGDFIFVHAGLSPSIALHEQQKDDLLWIRHEFISQPHSFGKIVVFGHTAFNEVLVDLPYKIGIDTGAAYGNKLSALELVSGELYQLPIGETSVQVHKLSLLLSGRP